MNIVVRSSIHHKERVLELGNIIINPELIQREVDSISIADLTGVAVQDIQIANGLYGALEAL